MDNDEGQYLCSYSLESSMDGKEVGKGLWYKQARLKDKIILKKEKA